FQWLMLFVVTQLLLIGDGLLPSQCWRSFTSATSRSGAVLRWVAIAANALVLLVGVMAGFGSLWCALCVLAFFAFVLTIRFTSRGELPPALPASSESPGPKKTSVRPAAA